MDRMEEIILRSILEYYINGSSSQKGIVKERVTTLRNMHIIIYPNDHDPPHFHVKSKDKTIDAKFQIKDGAYISGDISNKDLKRIKDFFNDVKTQTLMKKIWNKYQGTNLE